MILFEKFGQHQPLNRQSERYRREGIDLSVSTLADQVGACTTALQPLHALIERHVLAAERLHGDDTTVPILAKGKTVTGRIWTYVRDDRPFGGHAPPAALYYASRDRKHEYPVQHLQAITGQADAYSGYNELYDPGRRSYHTDYMARPSHGVDWPAWLADVLPEIADIRRLHPELLPGWKQPNCERPPNSFNIVLSKKFYDSWNRNIENFTKYLLTSIDVTSHNQPM